jgi:hypothetical protein
VEARAAGKLAFTTFGFGHDLLLVRLESFPALACWAIRALAFWATGILDGVLVARESDLPVGQFLPLLGRKFRHLDCS